MHRSGRQARNDSTNDFMLPTLHDNIAYIRNLLTTKNHELLTVLTSCISLNPYFRMTAQECLRLKVFDEVRDSTKDKILCEMHKARLGAEIFEGCGKNSS